MSISHSLKPEKVVYLIGSLEGPHVEDVAIRLREKFPTWEFFDEWRGAGETADKAFNIYRKKRGLSYKEALDSWGARHIFEFDKSHLDRADAVVLVMPAGKSGHLELGYAIGQGKKGYVLFESEPDVSTRCCSSVGILVVNFVFQKRN